MAKSKPTIQLHSYEDFKEITEELKKESDRATVILGAAKIDSQLYLLLSKYFLSSPNSQDELLDGDSPLGTFSAKISIAYRLGLINSHFAKSLHLIRKIRNSFAHEFKGMSLATGGHADRIRELVVHFKDYSEYQRLREDYFDKKAGLDIDFRMIVAIAIIRIDAAANFSGEITKEGVPLIPSVWKNKVDFKSPMIKSAKPKVKKVSIKK